MGVERYTIVEVPRLRYCKSTSEPLERQAKVQTTKPRNILFYGRTIAEAGIMKHLRHHLSPASGEQCYRGAL